MVNSRLSQLHRKEIQGYRRPKRIDIVEWLETRRFLSSRSEEGGPMRLARTPYVRPWLEAAVNPDIEEVVVCASAQVAKTEFGLTVAGYYADVERTTVLMSLPDEATARHISRDRVRKMFEDSPELSHLTDGAPVINNDELSLTNGGYIGVVWASSVAALGAKPFRIVIADEIDKPGYYVKSSEAMPLSLIRERTESYYSFKRIFFSTPTLETGNVTLELSGCDVVFDWHVPCPSCGVFQPLRFSPEHAYGFKKGKYLDRKGKERPLGGVAWEGRRKATREQIDGAVYQCGSCQSGWTTPEKNRAVMAGKSVARRPYVGKIRSAGFHINRLYSLLGKSGNLDRLVASFIKSKKSRNPRTMQGFINSTLAEPYVPSKRQRKIDVIQKLRDDRPRGIVPSSEPVSCLLAGVDTQDDGFFYEIRAFGYGLTRTSWGIREGKVPTFGDLAQVLWTDEYLDKAGKKYVVNFSLIDSAGHRTSEVYDFCRLHRGMILPTQGKQRMTQPFGYSELSYYPNTNKAIPGGVRLVRVDTNYYKSQLDGLLQIVPRDPGAWNYHSETTDDWLTQMTVEVLDDQNLWINPKSRANHAWDVSVLLLCAHELRGVGFWPMPGPSEDHRPRPDSPGGSGSKWLNRGGSTITGGKGWLNRE